MLLELFISFAKIGMFTFGGGYAMLALIEHECVENKKWISPEELMDITVIAESTPGPIAINCATYTGYKKAGIGGALIATIAMVLPSFLIILLLSSFLEELLKYDMAARTFKGIRVAVGFLITRAGIGMSRKIIKKSSHRLISLCVLGFFFVSALLIEIFGLNISRLHLIIISGILGICIFKESEESK